MAQAMAVTRQHHPWRGPVGLSLLLHLGVLGLLASNLSFCRHEVVLPPVPEHVRAVVVERKSPSVPRVEPAPAAEPPRLEPPPPAPATPPPKAAAKPVAVPRPAPQPARKPSPVKPVPPAAVKPVPVKPVAPALDLGALAEQEEKQRLAARDARRRVAQAAESSPSPSAARDEAGIREYEGLIAAEVEKRWSRPPSARAGMTARLRITLIPGGEVIDVRVVRSSGDPAFDRSAENAVRMAGRLPVPADPRLFNTYFRQINFDFDPKDLKP